MTIHVKDDPFIQYIVGRQSLPTGPVHHAQFQPDTESGPSTGTAGPRVELLGKHFAQAKTIRAGTVK